MNSDTKQEVIEKLASGWMLNGDIGSDTPFMLISPNQKTADSVPPVSAALVRELSKDDLLAPAALPGKNISYRKK